MNELKVVKHNKVIEAGYKISLLEQRIILACISQIDSTEPLTTEKDFYISVAEMKKMAGSGGDCHKAIKDAVTKLYNRSVIIDDYDEEKLISTTYTRWVTDVVYMKNTGMIKLGFARKILPYVSEIRGSFTAYKYKEIAGMKSVYSIRLYELLVQWLSSGEREIEIDWLKEKFGIAGKYERYSNLKERVLDVAVNEVNEKTTLKVKYKSKKTGRFVTSIQFSFSDEAARNEMKKTNGKISREYIEKNARIGESYADAEKRLSKPVPEYKHGIKPKEIWAYETDTITAHIYTDGKVFFYRERHQGQKHFCKWTEKSITIKGDENEIYIMRGGNGDKLLSNTGFFTR